MRDTEKVMAMGDMIRGRHGELESNHWDQEQQDPWLQPGVETVALTHEGLRWIRRLRLLSDLDFPFWDVSYCYGELRDGTKVRVQLPRHQFTKGKLYTELVQMGKEAGVYLKRLGVFDSDVISKVL